MQDFMTTQGLDLVGFKRWWSKDFKPSFQVETEVQALIENEVWRTADGRKIAVAQMTTGHINSCIKCWNGEGSMKIPPSYLGGKEKWLEIFERELLRRN